MAAEADGSRFRAAASQFMTGVTVVTTLDPEGTPVGFTANSFTSVSLDPPMVLFCLGQDSNTLTAFAAADGFVVHVLSADQQDLAVRFATKGIDRFAGTAWIPGEAGRPVLSEALATFECRTVHTYDGGDHLIFVGEVERFGTGDTTRAALGFFRGGYVLSPPD